MPVTYKDRANPPACSPPWTPVWSSSRSRWYFYNQDTRQTSWTCPQAEQAEQQTSPSSSSSAAATKQQEGPQQWTETPEFNELASNPHLSQVIANEGYSSRTDLPFTRLLLPEHPVAAYRRRKDETKSVIHWGQREALVLAIEFLTDYGEDGATVIYSGPLSVNCARVLFELFPRLKFHIFDDATRLEETDTCTVTRMPLSAEHADDFIGRQVLYISDIKTTKPGMTSKDANLALIDDIEKQMAMHNLIQPKKSMLKFRLPWENGSTDYLAGELRFPVWGAVTTTETRLVPHQGFTSYDHRRYEQQMFYFNTERRVARYQHPLVAVGTEGMDFCYDCKAEAEILIAYFTRCRGITDSYDVVKMASDLSVRISRMLGSRTLAEPNPDPDELREKIERDKAKKRSHVEHDDPISKRPDVYSDPQSS
eukprot:m.44785 g.44785  ORF g.44785 m.44785 type:complete len:424 (-) comp12132_c0_seq1:86-1357(-)